MDALEIIIHQTRIRALGQRMATGIACQCTYPVNAAEFATAMSHKRDAARSESATYMFATEFKGVGSSRRWNDHCLLLLSSRHREKHAGASMSRSSTSASRRLLYCARASTSARTTAPQMSTRMHPHSPLPAPALHASNPSTQSKSYVLAGVQDAYWSDDEAVRALCGCGPSAMLMLGIDD